MSVTQLTDEPCPKCGASLDVRLAPNAAHDNAGSQDPQDARSTVRLDRIQVCPECDWRKIL